MICPNCKKNERFKTVDSRQREWGIKRVKVCPNCGLHVPTVEIYDVSPEMIESLRTSQYLIEYKRRERKLNENV